MISSFSLPISDGTQRFELEYGWELLVDPTGRLQREDADRSANWRAARVGLSWNVQFEDLRDYMGAAWYRTSFEMPRFRDTRHVLLKFGAVDYFCEVFLNGLLVGTHEGGYTPFSFEVTNAIQSGVNRLVIRVVDPPMNEAQNRALFPEMMYNEIPHGKQNWYVQISGIWQGVRVECCPSIYVERLDVVSKISGEFELITRLAGIGLTAEEGAVAASVTLRAEISDPNGRIVFESTAHLDRSSRITVIKGAISNPRVWEPDNPALYFLEVSLSGPVVYRRRTRFGFRSFEGKNGKLYLNGKPFLMIAALDQDFYPETVHTPSSEESVRDMMTKAKSLGFNLLRCHLKVAHPVYLDIADEIGMLVWTELPSWSDCWFPSDHFSTMAAVRTEKMFWEILIRDSNHPCIVLQTIMNESWGVNLKEASQRAWLLNTFDRIKGLLEPLGRLVVDNSPCEGNFHLKTDIEDFHQYFSMPDQVDKWDVWLKELASRPEWTFSPYGDAVRTGQEPLMVSEFGNWGLPRLPSELPWWFRVAFGEREVTRPAGVLERFRDFGLDKVFGTYNQFADETQWHQFISLKHEIESIRSYDSLNGYVITGITDVHWEANGVMDMWRNKKVYADEIGFLQQPDLVMCKMPSSCFKSGDSITISTLISHYGEVDLRGARLRWTTDSGASGQFSLPETIERGCVTRLQDIELQLPKVDRPQSELLEIEIRTKHGHRLAENSYDIFVLPAPKAAVNISVYPFESAEVLAPKLKDIGFSVSGPNANSVMLSDAYNAAVAEHLSAGGKVLLLVQAESALPPEWPLKITPRAGSELDGRWFSNFNWIRPLEEPFLSVAFDPILGFESVQVVPDYAIEGIDAKDFNDVLSGLTLGWINRNSGLALQMRIGPGKMIVTTYRFTAYGIDAYATNLLNAFIRYVASPNCLPNLQLSPAIPAAVNA